MDKDSVRLNNGLCCFNASMVVAITIAHTEMAPPKTGVSTRATPSSTTITPAPATAASTMPAYFRRTVGIDPLRVTCVSESDIRDVRYSSATDIDAYRVPIISFLQSMQLGIEKQVC
jgi:hypothetical protein